MAYENTTQLLTRGFGDHGFYAEAHGPSHVTRDTGFLTWLQAAKIACGKDFITPDPNGQWVSLRWVMEIVPQGGRPQVLDRKSKAGGGYGTDAFTRTSPWSHGGQFAQGFGAVDPKYLPAMLWVYRNFVEPAELRGDLYDTKVFSKGWLKKGERSYDAFRSPWHAVMSFVNWPIGIEPANPVKVMPKAMEDRIHGYYVFRNRWKDADDIVVSALLGYGPTDAYYPQSGPIYVWGYGQKFSFGKFLSGRPGTFEPKADGSGLVVADGKQLAVDMSGASGAGLLIASIGIGEGAGGEGRCQADESHRQAGRPRRDVDNVHQGHVTGDPRRGRQGGYRQAVGRHREREDCSGHVHPMSIRPICHASRRPGGPGVLRHSHSKHAKL